MDDDKQPASFPSDLTIGPPNLYNISQAARELKLSRETVRALVESGILASVSIGARRYIRRAVLVAYADGR